DRDLLHWSCANHWFFRTPPHAIQIVHEPISASGATAMINEGLKLAALYYAEIGLSVFPCHGVVDGQCTCGKPLCENPGKHPKTKNGLLDATGTQTVIAEWWRKWPQANIGIACKDFLAVLDIDPRHGGMEAFGDLQSNFGPDIFETPISETGGGGL